VSGSPIAVRAEADVDEAHAALMAAITEYFQFDRVPSAEAELAALGVDSLGHFELVCLIEEEAGYGVADAHTEYPVLGTIEDCTVYYDELCAARAPAGASLREEPPYED